jgi:integrase
LSLAQAQELLKAAEGSRWYGCIALSLLSGLRAEEVRALGWEHVVGWVEEDAEWRPVADAGFDHDMFAIFVWRAERAGGDVKTPRSRRSRGSAVIPTVPQITGAALAEVDPGGRPPARRG